MPLRIRVWLPRHEELSMQSETQSFWNLIAVGLPAVAVVIGLLSLGGSGTGDWAGRLGEGVLLVIGVGAACGLGAIAAAVALARGEARVWLSIVALVGNLAVALPVAGLLLRR